mmetsp:Transcript_1834/g.5388  ORF Transcript_1834/g.5388 Transcript_1834/m.5388 type:complete len:241 (+) Transcript_1834:191-913(+)
MLCATKGPRQGACGEGARDCKQNTRAGDGPSRNAGRDATLATLRRCAAAPALRSGQHSPALPVSNPDREIRGIRGIPGTAALATLHRRSRRELRLELLANRRIVERAYLHKDRSIWRARGGEGLLEAVQAAVVQRVEEPLPGGPCGHHDAHAREVLNPRGAAPEISGRLIQRSAVPELVGDAALREAHVVQSHFAHSQSHVVEAALPSWLQPAAIRDIGLCLRLASAASAVWPGRHGPAS